MPGMAGVSGPARARGRGVGGELGRSERELLLRLQQRAMQYFLDNQVPDGLILDRQSNRGPLRAEGLCSTSATGMGLIALALASAAPHRLLSPGDASARIRAALEAAERDKPFSELLGSLIALHRAMAPNLDIHLDLRDGALENPALQREEKRSGAADAHSNPELVVPPEVVDDFSIVGQASRGLESHFATQIANDPQ